MKNYDYSQSGYYFITICTQNRECFFGEIINNSVGAIHESPNLGNDSPVCIKLNNIGIIIENILHSLPNRFPIKLDEFQIMPNHVHMIIKIAQCNVECNVRAIHESPLQKTSKRSLLSQIIGYLKMNSTKMIHNSVRAHHDAPLHNKIFQRNYYEHIIRNEDEYLKIKEYIKLNPSMWERDRNNQNNKLL